MQIYVDHSIYESFSQKTVINMNLLGKTDIWHNNNWILKVSNEIKNLRFRYRINHSNRTRRQILNSGQTKQR